MQAVPSCQAICSVRPIKRVKVFSPNPVHRAAFVKEMAGERFEVVAVDDPREVVRGSHVIACNTNSKVPVLQGEWLEPGQMLVTIGNSDVASPRHEVDEATFARASEIMINDWDSVAANRQIELSGPIASGLVKRENVHELGDVVTGKVTLKRDPGGIVFYKNNTGLAIQFAACGAILHKKLLAEGTNRTIPTEWFASGKPHI
jgi:ornithine cyclodeaminase/alanine dehydrogenase-like protein (mu-crystallin family)